MWINVSNVTYVCGHYIIIIIVGNIRLFTFRLYRPKPTKIFGIRIKYKKLHYVDLHQINYSHTLTGKCLLFGTVHLPTHGYVDMSKMRACVERRIVLYAHNIYTIRLRSTCMP